jgi:energy-coupling factor transporter ATP-binding protein EcfA2
MIELVRLKHFTAFESLELRPAPGINVLIGENGTGKTHLMKVLYAACDISQSGKTFPEKLVKLFLPHEERIGRLVKRRDSSSMCELEVVRQAAEQRLSIGLIFSSHTQSHTRVREQEQPIPWRSHPIHSVYIPVKDMMANAPGFRSLYALRQIHFEEIYSDILDRAFLNVLRGPMDPTRRRLLGILQDAMDGKVLAEGEAFFLRNKSRRTGGASHW